MKFHRLLLETTIDKKTIMMSSLDYKYSTSFISFKHYQKMMNSNQTVISLWPCINSFHFLSWSLPCILCRIGSIIIFVVSIICLKINVHYLYTDRRQNSLVISLFLASVLIIAISVPGILLQLFTCHRHCMRIYCRIEGFVSYLCGCLCMLVAMTLSIHRYLTLYSNLRSSYVGFLTFISWFLSLAFTFPLLFDYFNTYMPEGLGFHCSINWQSRSKKSRLYILLSFIMMYFIPLAILIFVSARSHSFIRNIYSQCHLSLSFSRNVDEKETKTKFQQTNSFKHSYANECCVAKATNCKRLRADYQFLRAIVFLVGSYILAWTPYSIVAVMQLLNVKFIFKHAALITMCALIAKTSVILTPIVYLIVMHSKSVKHLLK